MTPAISWLFIVACIAVWCLGAQSAVAAAPGGYPNVRIQQDKSGSLVYWDDKLIVELKENRYLRFRATPADENWVGAERGGFDLCWDYAHYRADKSRGFELLGATQEHHPERGEFSLIVDAKKPGIDDSRIHLVLAGTWDAKAKCFNYTLSSSLQCKLEDWYQHIGTKGTSRKGATIEVTDYHIEYISMPDRNLSKSRKEPQKYPWFVKSQDGQSWSKSPKVHMPFPMRPGNYVTIGDKAHPCPAGAWYGFLDPEHGGWLTQVKKTPAPVSFSLCWMFFDVHIIVPGAIPPRGSTQTMSLDFQLAFTPVNPPRARQIISSATELPWRADKEYALPLFSRDNRFDKLITDLPSEETGLHNIWWANSYDCYRDDKVGYDDHYSVSIKRDKPSAMPAAWTLTSWGYPHESVHVFKHRMRLTAMVKTLDCTGPVSIGFGSWPHADLFYGTVRTHSKDGKLLPEIELQRSSSLSGTNDWTKLSFEFVVPAGGHCLFLEQQGTGQCWFDNVKIEDLRPAK